MANVPSCLKIVNLLLATQVLFHLFVFLLLIPISSSTDPFLAAAIPTIAHTRRSQPGDYWWPYPSTPNRLRRTIRKQLGADDTNKSAKKIDDRPFFNFLFSTNILSISVLREGWSARRSDVLVVPKFLTAVVNAVLYAGVDATRLTVPVLLLV